MITLHDAALLRPPLTFIEDWCGSPARKPADFDAAKFAEVIEGLMKVSTPYGGGPELRAALMKVLVTIVGAGVRHGTDEDVFRAAQDVRDEVYFEIMRLRRAALRDVDAGALDG